jgi:predicted phosphodiesterase
MSTTPGFKWTKDLEKIAIESCAVSKTIKSAFDRWVGLTSMKISADAFENKLKRLSKSGKASELLTTVGPWMCEDSHLFKWTKDLEKIAVESCAVSKTVKSAQRRWAGLTGINISFAAFDSKLQRLSKSGRSTEFLMTAKSELYTDAHALTDLVHRHPLSVEDASDKLDWGVSRVRAAYHSAKECGLSINIINDELSCEKPLSQVAKQIDLGDHDATDGIITVASDLHLGHVNCLRESLCDHLKYGHSKGSRMVFIPGDLVEGMYRHASYKRLRQGITDQINLVLDPHKGLPILQDSKYVLISGNHDETFAEAAGIDFGQFLLDRARSLGRDDIIWAGDRGAYVVYRGITVYMWHPKKGASYALSYHMQNWIRDLDGDHPRPNILLMGHQHRCVFFRNGKTYAFAAGTFQHGQDSYGLSLGGAVALGGWVIEWTRRKNVITSILPEWRHYKGPSPFKKLKTSSG